MCWARGVLLGACCLLLVPNSASLDTCSDFFSSYSSNSYDGFLESSKDDEAYQLLFPDIIFDCSGYITSVSIVVQSVDHTLTRSLVFQAWSPAKPNDMNSYFLRSTQILSRNTNNNNDSVSVDVLKFNLKAPLPVSAGDMVGMYVPQLKSLSRPFSLAYSSTDNSTVYQATMNDRSPCNVSLCSPSFEVLDDREYKFSFNFSLNSMGTTSSGDVACTPQSNFEYCPGLPIETTTSSTSSTTTSSQDASDSISVTSVALSSVSIQCSPEPCSLPPSSSTLTILMISVPVAVFLLLVIIAVITGLVVCRKKMLSKKTEKVDPASIPHYQAQNGSVYTAVTLRKSSTGNTPDHYDPTIDADDTDALQPYAELRAFQPEIPARTITPEIPARTNILSTSSFDFSRTPSTGSKSNTPKSPHAASMFDLLEPKQHSKKRSLKASLSSVPESPNTMSMFNVSPRRATVSGMGNRSPSKHSPTPYMQPTLSKPKSTEQIFSFREKNLKKVHTHSSVSGIASPSSIIGSPFLASVVENEDANQPPYQEPFASVRSPITHQSASVLNRSPFSSDRKVSMPLLELSRNHKKLAKTNSVDLASPYLEPSPTLKPKRLLERFRSRANTTGNMHNIPSDMQSKVTLINVQANVTENNDSNGIYSKLTRDDDADRNQSTSLINSPSDVYDTAHFKKYREIPREQISIGEKLGSGHFGKVYCGKWNFHGGHLDVAIKALKSGLGEAESKMFLKEAETMAQFFHPNVVQLHGVVSIGEPLIICLELMTRGDLKHYLKEIKTTHQNVIRNQVEYTKQFLSFCRHVASGMNYLASKDFVHRDLAARNIFLTDEMVCKIGDFGMSRGLAQDEIYESKGRNIPLRWTAPEAVNYLTYTIASDVWSYGMLLFEIWSLGHKPFHDKSVEEIHALISSPYCLPPPPGCPRNLYKLMIQCWNRDASLRPSFSLIVETLSESDEILLEQNETGQTPSPTLGGSPPTPGTPPHSSLGASLNQGLTLYQDLQYYYYDDCC